MPTKLEVYNLALLNIRESKLSSLTENREARRNLDSFYDTDLQWMMEAGFWKFALRSVSITADPDTSTAFGQTKVFNKPADWVKTYIVSSSEMMEPMLDGWIEEGNAFISDVDPLYVRYVSNSDDGYGYDLSRWTARFTKAMSWKLSASIAPKTTGASDNALENIERKADKALKDALTFEAMREPNRGLPEGRWNNSRFRGRGSLSHRIA